jgi:NADH-quinone oxidoreductase subunit J
MPALVLGRVAIGEALIFFAAAGITLGAAVSLILQRNPVHAAMLLVATLFGVALLFVLQQAHFLAAVQVIVYAGAIVVLFLFVIMLLGVDKRDDLHETLPLQRPLAIGLGVVLVAMVFALASTKWVTASPNTDPHSGLVAGSGTVEALGRSLFARYLFPFEMTSVLLVIAAVGAVVLARRSGDDEGDLDDATADQADAEGRAG